MKSAKIKPARIWMPKCRAATFQDKRTKRERTRSDKIRKVMREYSV